MIVDLGYAGTQVVVGLGVVAAGAGEQMAAPLGFDVGLDLEGAFEGPVGDVRQGITWRNCRSSLEDRELSLAVGDAVEDGIVSRAGRGRSAKGDRRSLVVDWKMAFVEGCRGAIS